MQRHHFGVLQKQNLLCMRHSPAFHLTRVGLSTNLVLTRAPRLLLPTGTTPRCRLVSPAAPVNGSPSPSLDVLPGWQTPRGGVTPPRGRRPTPGLCGRTPVTRTPGIGSTRIHCRRHTPGSPTGGTPVLFRAGEGLRPGVPHSPLILEVEEQGRGMWA
jgi:hypothetical protein